MEQKISTTPVRAAPIMDVAPPPQNSKPSATNPVQKPLEQPLAEASIPKKEQKQAASQSKNTQPAQGLPGIAIACAVVLFAALTALAYYAYTKAN